MLTFLATPFPSKSKCQNGSVGLYIKSYLGPIPRPELVSNGDDYETCWIQFHNSKDKNFFYLLSKGEKCSQPISSFVYTVNYQSKIR